MRLSSLILALLLAAPVIASQPAYDSQCDHMPDATLRERALSEPDDPLTWVKCDNWLSFTIYDRDLEGIPRAAWIQIGQIMDCVRAVERSATFKPLLNDAAAIRETLAESVDTMRHDDDIAGGTMMIYSAVRQLNDARLLCEPYTEAT